MENSLYFFVNYNLTWLILLPALVFGLIAQFAVKSSFSRYDKEFTQGGLTGAQAAQLILDNNGLSDVRISTTAGRLSDYYDPRNNTIFLSDSVYNNRSISAIGVAAHETGHAIQYAERYGPITVKNSILPVTQVGNMLSTPLILIGLIFGFTPLITAGIILFGAILAFQIITLPIEFNASRRALTILENYSILLPDENAKAKKVLTAAAMTYVAAVVSSIATLLRLILISRRRR